MKQLFLFVLMLITMSLSGQKCDYSKNEVDPFTNELRKEVEVSVGSFGESITLKLCRMGSNYLLKFHYCMEMAVKNNSYIPTDKPLAILMQNGDVVNLPSDGNSTVTSLNVSGLMSPNIYMIDATFTADSIAFDKFTHSLPVKIRFYIDLNEFTRDIKQRNGSQLMIAAGCVLKND